MEYYIKLLSKLGKIELKENSIDRNINWVFGDFQINKYSKHTEFYNKNKRLYLSHLCNGGKEIINRYMVEEIDDLLNKSIITKNDEFIYMCSKQTSILSFGYSAFHKQATGVLKNQEIDLKQEKVYEEQLQAIYKKQTLLNMFEYSRFYELSFIKKHFVRKLLQDLSNETYTTLQEYNSLRMDLNFLKLRYNEEILFKVEGSAKELYTNILEKTNTNKLLRQAEELFKNIREDVINKRDLAIKSNENTILIISSVLTIVLGYTGLKLIVNDVLANSPYIGNYISSHPLRYTIVIWSVLVMVMTWLNIKRWYMNRK